MDPHSKKVLFSRYVRHNARQAETVHKLLQEVFSEFPDAEFRVAVCGSGGRIIADAIHVPYVQEVVANAIAVRTFYPHARVAIELGGQDAKIIFFYHDTVTDRLVASDMRMNGSCAGGTGAFIDEVANLLRIPVEQFESLAAKGTSIYDISGRCGVFAKTDIQPLLNQGGLREDIALSTFHAIVKQTIGGLAQGLEIKPPVIFEGGPLNFNPTLIQVFAERLGFTEADIIRPENPETIIAYGAALAIDELFADVTERFDPHAALSELVHFREHITQHQPETYKTYFTSDQEQQEFKERHTLPPPPHCSAARGDTLRVYLGIDAGSTTTKFVLIDEDETVVDTFYSNNRGEPLRVIKHALLDLRKKYQEAGITLEIIAVGTTGYGELLFDKALGADYHTVETVAHTAAAKKYVPDVSFILDIGGQDMKAINISNDIVTNITLNEACSSGCGSFLENFAATLDIPVDKIAEVSFDAKNPAELGSRCTVFMNSTIITEQRNGKQANDIMAGLCRSIIENVFTKVVRISNFAGLGNKIVVQGGTFKNDAVLRALEQHIGKPVIRAPYPGEMGAIGIALLTKKYKSEVNSATSRFIGLDNIEQFDYTQEANIVCPLCTNNCNRTHIVFSNGATWVTGNRCERGEIIGDPKDPAIRERVKQVTARIEAVPDMVKIREHLLFKDYPFIPVLPENNITIGLPRALDFWRTMPFFTTFFHALGFKTKISPKSSRMIFEQGIPFVASDTVCFPAKLAHGHIHALAEQNVDRIFMPLFNRFPSDNPEKASTYTCPVLKGYPLVIKYSDDPERRWNVTFDTPIFHWFKKRDRNYQLCRYMRDTFGIEKQLTRQAIDQAEEALDSFNAELVAEAEKIIEAVEEQGIFAVVLAGRHYQFDELVNHNLSKYFTGIGIPVLTVDSLPGLQQVELRKTRLDITNNNHARLLSGAILAAQHPALEYVEIFSFGCGHDALYTDEVIRIMNEISGKSPLILKLDESDVAGPLRIRVRSFIETVQMRRAKESLLVRELGEPFEVKFGKVEKKTKTVLVPNVSSAFSKILTATFRHQNIKAESLPLGGHDAIELGKKYVHNDICFPAQMIIGEALAVLKSGKYDPDTVAVGTGKTLCDCRLVNYMVLTRKALDEAGFPQVPVLSSDLVDLKNLHPGFKFTELTYMRIVWCLVMVDILEDLRRKIRPYELNTGETDRVFEQSVDAISDALDHKGMQGAFFTYRKAIHAMCSIKYDKSEPRSVVFITGEYLLTFHPGTNFNIETYLEKNNMEVKLPRMYDIYRNLMLLHTISEVKDFKVQHSIYDTLYAFIGDKYFDMVINVMEIPAKKHPLYEPCIRLPDMAKLSDPILHHSIQSGEGFLMVADILHHAGQGIRSFIILQPFGCLPNHVCGRGMVKRIKEEYPAIQILPLDYDPDTSFANIENRLQMLIMNTRNFNTQPDDILEEELAFETV
jgi:predicted CoA-substrate-specific enzyme activase